LTKNSREAFQCLSCDLEFVSPPDMAAGMANLLSFPCKQPDCCICGEVACRSEYCDQCKTTRAGIPCHKGSCPRCGSSYVEWLTREVNDEDIYFSIEWNNGARQWPGSYKMQGSEVIPRESGVIDSPSDA